MLRDSNEASLSESMQQTKIPQIIVDYLKLQQTKNQNFFNLFIEKKINGRLFYNTCMPNGEKEVRYGNDDFLNDAFSTIVDDMLAPFSHVSLDQVKCESVHPTGISTQMNEVIVKLLSHIESSSDWINFWEKEINLKYTGIQKKKLYNLVASNAAYKALVACVDHSKYILDPHTKRNVAVLIDICTGKYESPFLLDGGDFKLRAKTDETAFTFNCYTHPVPAQ